MTEAELAALVADYLKTKDTDLFAFSGEIDEASTSEFVRQLGLKSNRRSTITLFLTTFGGDPHAAFRIGKALRHYYPKGVRLLLAGPCKSAGTLIALGASELAFGAAGELGPLDIQLNKPDELLLSGSGLDVLQSLLMVTDSAFSSFETFMVNLVSRSGGRVSTKTAADVAARLSAQLFEPVMAQIDPFRLGEVKRAISIARAYGERLSEHAGNNLNPGAIDTLIEGYPSHGFVIDVDEAQKLFKRVVQLDDTEALLATRLDRLVGQPTSTPMTFDLERAVSSQAPVPTDAATTSTNGHASTSGADVPGESANSRPHSEANGTGGEVAGPSIDVHEPAVPTD